MLTHSNNDTAANPPDLRVAGAPGEGQVIALAGDWTTLRLARRVLHLKRQLMHYGALPRISWDLSGLEKLDHTGALLLWRAWGRSLPETLRIPPAMKEYFTRLSSRDVDGMQRAARRLHL